MAAGKQTPRQKMISMMYLVLTAMLALNVSKEILEAFVTVNNGLETTKTSFDKDVAGLYAKFDEKKSIDPLRVQAMWAKAQEAKKLSKDIGAYLEEMKKMLLRESEGYKHKEEDTIHLDYVDGKERYDVTTDILCGADEDGQNGQAHVLRGKLDAYKKAMLDLLPAADKATMHLNIESKDPTDGGEYRTWEMKTFYHTPLAADITILSKIQDDVKGAEADVVEALLKQTDSDIIPFDTVAARVIATTNYVMLGDTFKSDIFLAAFNKTLKPQILLGNFNPATGKMEGAYDSVPVSNGLGKYFVNATKEGIFTYKGVINMTTPKGKVMQYPFESEYIVARPALTVSAEKMNVMYAGLENPISVSVPGVPNDKAHVSCNNGILTPLGNGKYMITKPTAGKPCQITVMADMADGSKRNMGMMEFRVKPLPKPFASIGVEGSKVSAAKMGSVAGLGCSYGPDFEFKASPRVTSFTYTYSVNGVFSSVHVNGNMFSAADQAKFRAMRKGAHIIIEDIMAVGPDNKPVSLSPMSLTIN